MSYENGMSYTATISEISTYPLEGSYYNGTGNPNSSTYEFTAVVDNPEGLSNGMYLDITLSTSGNVSVDGSSDALYLDKAYIREDEGGSYVMKSGIDNRLYKQYLELGATIYSGNYVEIISGLTVDDYIAFRLRRQLLQPGGRRHGKRRGRRGHRKQPGGRRRQRGCALLGGRRRLGRGHCRGRSRGRGSLHQRQPGRRHRRAV